MHDILYDLRKQTMQAFTTNISRHNEMTEADKTALGGLLLINLSMLFGHDKALQMLEIIKACSTSDSPEKLETIYVILRQIGGFEKQSITLPPIPTAAIQPKPSSTIQLPQL